MIVPALSSLGVGLFPQSRISIYPSIKTE